MKLGLTALRWVEGGLFVGHGTQKLFGWFGGHGLEGTGNFFESIGLRPGRRHATAAGAAEAGGGALLALGLFTPAVGLTLADVGPGDLSLDHVLDTEVKGPLVALAALAGGIAGAELTTHSPAPQGDQSDVADTPPTPAPAPSESEPAPAVA
jgi:hypothetical protein